MQPHRTPVVGQQHRLMPSMKSWSPLASALNLREVPVSAEVVTGPTIAGQGVVTLQDLTQTLPAVTLAKGSTTDRLFVRGIGSGDNPSFEQSVGF
jgi:hypothetical protein